MIRLTLMRQPKRAERFLKSAGWCTVNKSAAWQQPWADARWFTFHSQSTGGSGGLEPDRPRQPRGMQLFSCRRKKGSKRRKPPTGSTFVLSGLDVMDDGIKLCCMRGCRDLKNCCYTASRTCSPRGGWRAPHRVTPLHLNISLLN